MVEEKDPVVYLERGGRWWLGTKRSRVELRLSSQSVWQIVTQISWARLLVKPTLGIDPGGLVKQNRTSSYAFRRITIYSSVMKCHPVIGARGSRDGFPGWDWSVQKLLPGRQGTTKSMKLRGFVRSMLWARPRPWHTAHGGCMHSKCIPRVYACVCDLIVDCSRRAFYVVDSLRRLSEWRPKSFRTENLRLHSERFFY